MAKLADALDLGSSSERSEGSSPFIRISKIVINPQETMPGVHSKLDVVIHALILLSKFPNCEAFKMSAL